MQLAHTVAERRFSNDCARTVIRGEARGEGAAIQGPYYTLDRWSNIPRLMTLSQRTLKHSKRFPFTMCQSLVHSQGRHLTHITAMYIFETFRLGSLVAFEVRFFFFSSKVGLFFHLTRLTVAEKFRQQNRVASSKKHRSCYFTFYSMCPCMCVSTRNTFNNTCESKQQCGWEPNPQNWVYAILALKLPRKCSLQERRKREKWRCSTREILTILSGCERNRG